MSIDVMKQAIAALEMYLALDTVEDSILLEQVIAPEAITALRAAIEQAQEPVAWMYEHDGMVHNADNPPIFSVNRWNTPVGEPYAETPLYTAPRQWQGLTDEEIAVIMVRELGVDEDIDAMSCFARSIEAKLREKNT